ncbi:MAG: hypothetical protein WC551_13500 [Patescibacteria group bacterium]
MFDLLYPRMYYNGGGLVAITDVYAAANLIFAQGSFSTLAINAPGGKCAGLCLTGDSVTGGFPVQGITGDLYGIIVGTGNAAVTTGDHKLQTRINQGAGAGQMEYGGSEVLTPTFADPNGELILRRYITNRSGGDIVVAESGIYAFAGITDNLHGSIYCIARDVVGPAVTVHTTEILVVTYTVQITV